MFFAARKLSHLSDAFRRRRCRHRRRGQRPRRCGREHHHNLSGIWPSRVRRSVAGPSAAALRVSSLSPAATAGGGRLPARRHGHDGRSGPGAPRPVHAPGPRTAHLCLLARLLPRRWWPVADANAGTAVPDAPAAAATATAKCPANAVGRFDGRDRRNADAGEWMGGSGVQRHHSRRPQHDGGGGLCESAAKSAAATATASAATTTGTIPAGATRHDDEAGLDGQRHAPCRVWTENDTGTAPDQSSSLDPAGQWRRWWGSGGQQRWAADHFLSALGSDFAGWSGWVGLDVLSLPFFPAESGVIITYEKKFVMPMWWGGGVRIPWRSPSSSWRSLIFLLSHPFFFLSLSLF